MRIQHRPWRAVFVGFVVMTGAALGVTALVVHGQNVASGQIFAEPPVAPPAIAQRILQRLQKLSALFGTQISIEGNVGVIRVTPSTRSSGLQD